MELFADKVKRAYGSKTMPVHELFGPSGRVKAHHRPLSKVVALEQLRASSGSKEVIMKAHGFHKGSNAQVRSAKIGLYMDAVKKRFRTSNGISLS